ncbi:MAG: isoprenyl transferase [Cytophagia bacterium]|nr:MAG: isoprenyl transferase [Cytophagales bacterium]TAG00865.1 MAG: isoprenyl transferase [Cytophagia bacterium]TAG43428.1 MAG: isoprenyl transferase [Cytophagia bacterium]TAH29345.1 MAG: isoprenyl transferase [Cytophagales bacterium]
MTQSEINLENLPEHIAIIMDGNGRWAKKKGAMRVFGHQNAIKSVRETTEFCAELGVKYVTLYAFSTENWQRPKEEVEALMNLLVNTIHKETPTLLKNNVKLLSIGDNTQLPQKCQKNLTDAIKKTAHCTGLNLVLALSYSGRWEITQAMKKIAQKIESKELNSDEITENLIEKYLETANMPDPELLIRTSGEMRISNFLLWQLAYTEIFVTSTLWPDFRKKDLEEAILDYQKRERRFGKISEQIR